MEQEQMKTVEALTQEEVLLSEIRTLNSFIAGGKYEEVRNFIDGILTIEESELEKLELFEQRQLLYSNIVKIVEVL